MIHSYLNSGMLGCKDSELDFGGVCAHQVEFKPMRARPKTDYTPLLANTKNLLDRALKSLKKSCKGLTVP